jgi:hypothetical protein
VGVVKLAPTASRLCGALDGFPSHVQFLPSLVMGSHRA